MTKRHQQLKLIDIPSIYDEHWVDMPEFNNSALAEKSVHVHFKTEEDFLSFCEKIGMKIKTYSIWYKAE